MREGYQEGWVGCIERSKVKKIAMASRVRCVLVHWINYIVTDAVAQHDRHTHSHTLTVLP